MFRWFEYVSLCCGVMLPHSTAPAGGLRLTPHRVSVHSARWGENAHATTDETLPVNKRHIKLSSMTQT